MLTTWSRLITRSMVRHVLNKPLNPLLKGRITVDQFRALAVKATPPKRTAAKKPATKATAAKKTTASAGTKKTAAATKKAATKKTPAATKKAAAAKKTVAKKPAVKKAVAPVKKVVRKTPEERQKELVKVLKEKALYPPTHPNSVNVWLEFLRQKIKGSKGEGGLAKTWAAHGEAWKTEFDNLTDAQKEAYKATRAKEVSNADETYKNWVLEHTPGQIHEANLARARLRRLRDSEKPPHGLKTYPLKDIVDDRFPKRPRNSLIMFVKDRLKNYQGEANMDKMKYVQDSGKIFNTLSEAEKAKYKDLASQDLKRYHDELRTIGIQPSVRK